MQALQAIVDFFIGLASVIGSIIDFVVDMMGDLLFIVGLLAKFMIEIPVYFFWLPEGISGLVYTAFGIVVIYMIMNRK